MGLRILGIDEVGVVGGYYLYAMLARKVDEYGVDLLLLYESLAVSAGHRGLVALKFDIVVLSKCLLEPQNLLLCLGKIAFGDETRNLTTKTGGAYDESFAMRCKCSLIGTGMVVETLSVALRHDFNEILISLEVLSDDNEVTAFVGLIGCLLYTSPSPRD